MDSLVNFFASQGFNGAALTVIGILLVTHVRISGVVADLKQIHTRELAQLAQRRKEQKP